MRGVCGIVLSIASTGGSTAWLAGLVGNTAGPAGELDGTKLIRSGCRRRIQAYFPPRLRAPAASGSVPSRSSSARSFLRFRSSSVPASWDPAARERPPARIASAGWRGCVLAHPSSRLVRAAAGHDVDAAAPISADRHGRGRHVIAHWCARSNGSNVDLDDDGAGSKPLPAGTAG